MKAGHVILLVIGSMVLVACGGGGGSSPPTPPQGNSSTITIDEDTEASGLMTGLAGEGGTLTFSVTGQPTNGSLAVDGANFTYTPDADFNGTDSLTFIVTESGRSSQPVTITFNVTPVNDAPVSADSAVSTDEDVTLEGDVDASDIDGDTLTLSIETTAANGVVTAGAGTSFTYEPAANFFGQDSFSFTVSDGEFSTAAAAVTIDVASVNDPPEVADIMDTVIAGTPVTYDLTGTDVENDALTYGITNDFAKATVSNDPTTTGLLDVTPNYGEWGADSATYIANDGQADSAPATISIDIEVPATSSAITSESYDSSGQVFPLSVTAGDGETLYLLGNVFGDFIPASSSTTEQQFVALYDADAGARIREVYLGGEELGRAASGFVDGRLVAAGSEIDAPTTVRILTLDINDDVDVDATVSVPYAITRTFQHLEPIHVPGVGFFILGNDNQLSLVDYNGVLQSTVAIPTPLSTIVQRYEVHDVRIIDDLVYVSGGIFECSDDPDQCFGGVGSLGFVLTATTAGAVQGIADLTPDFPVDSVILDDGRTAAQLRETLYLVDVDGSTVWQRTVPGAVFGDVLAGNVGVDAAGDIYWFSYNLTTNNAHAERVTAANDTVWQTDQPAGLLGSFWPNDMAVDEYGNMFVSFIDRYNDMGSAFGRLVNMHFDYAGAHQWTAVSEPSDMAPNPERARKAILTSGYRFVSIGRDNIDAGGPDSDAFLFINTVRPAPP